MLILIFEWAIVLYLHYNNPYHFITMSKDTLTILLTGLSFIVLGYYFINSFYLDSSNKLPGDRDEIRINEALLGKTILLISILSVIGLIFILQEISTLTNNFSMYINNPILARERIVLMQEGKIASVSFFRYKIGIYLFSFMYPFAAVAGVVSQLRTKWRLTGIIPLILVLSYSLIHLNRVGLISALGLFFFARIYFGMYLHPKRRRSTTFKTAISIIVGVVFIAMFFYFIISIRSSKNIDIEYYALRSVYSYLTGSGSAFDKFLFEGVNPLYGASSFRSIVRWLASFGLVDHSIALSNFNSFVNIGEGFPMRLNTYTFVKSPYEDFGIVGVGIISLIWGMITRYSVERCFRGFSFVNILFVSLMILSLFMTFFEFFFQGIVMFVFYFIIIIVFEKYLKAKNAL